MNREFLNLYEEELRHLRGTAASEFAASHPRVAAQLRLERDTCDDPFVERLLEGFAFMAARVRHQLESDSSVFAQGLLESVYPALLSPIPSMGIVQLFAAESLSISTIVPKDTPLMGRLGEESSTRCEFRTAHDVRIDPVGVFKEEGRKQTGRKLGTRFFDRDLGDLGLPRDRGVRSAIRVTLETTVNDLQFSQIDEIDDFVFYLGGGRSDAGRISEELLAHCSVVYLRAGDGGPRSPWIECKLNEISGTRIESYGLGKDEAILPQDNRVFEGHRLLMEASSLPERMHFIKLSGLGKALQKIDSGLVEITFGIDRGAAQLRYAVGPESLVLNAVPVINLFEYQANHIPFEKVTKECHVIPNRTKPLDFEVIGVKSVKGLGPDLTRRAIFEPFYRSRAVTSDAAGYYTIRREERQLLRREREGSMRTRYLGSEVYLSFVDSKGKPLQKDLETLSIRVLCSNRHLPLTMVVKGASVDDTHLLPPGGSGLSAVKWLVTPTAPREALAKSVGVWRLVNLLSLNYLSLVDNGDHEGGSALKSLLQVYFEDAGSGMMDWVEGVVGLNSNYGVQRSSDPGPVAFQRGINLDLTLDETRFAGGSAFLFGSLISKFLSGQVSINTFLNTRVLSESRGELKTWKSGKGRRAIL